LLLCLASRAPGAAFAERPKHLAGFVWFLRGGDRNSKERRSWKPSARPPGAGKTPKRCPREEGSETEGSVAKFRATATSAACRGEILGGVNKGGRAPLSDPRRREWHPQWHARLQGFVPIEVAVAKACATSVLARCKSSAASAAPQGEGEGRGKDTAEPRLIPRRYSC
jgi:hypothetical protein